MYRKLGALVLCMTVSACSSSGSSDGNNGGVGAGGAGTGASSGSAGSSTGGTSSSGAGSHAGGNGGTGASSGSGATSGAVRGAFSVNVQAPAGCTLTAQTQDFPVIAGSHPVTATDKSGEIADKSNDASGNSASVHCTWFTDTAPYMIDAGLMVGPASNRRTVSMSSTLVAGSGSDGRLTLHDQSLPDADYAASCTFSVINLDAATHSVWGNFTCQALDGLPTDTATDPTGCTVGTSYFSFENCTKP